MKKDKKAQNAARQRKYREKLKKEKPVVKEIIVKLKELLAALEQDK